QRADLYFEPREQARLRGLLSHESGARRGDAALLLRGDHVEGPPDAFAGRRQAGLQLLPGSAMAAALDDAAEGRRPVPADVRRVRPNQAAVVARRQPPP